MKLKKGESRIVYRQEDAEPLERDVILEMVRGKSLSESRAVVEQYEKETETTWVDAYGRPQATSYADFVLAIEIKVGDTEAKQKELLLDLKEGLEAISRDDCGLDDIRKALRAQIAYSEFEKLNKD